SRYLGSRRLRHSGPVVCLAVSPDERRIASIGIDGTLSVWNTITGEQEGRVGDFQFIPSAITFISNHVVAGGGSGGLQVTAWDLHTGKAVHRFGEKSYWGAATLFLPARGVLLVAEKSTDKLVTPSRMSIWSWRSRQLLHVLGPFQEPICQIAASSD